MGDQQKIQNRKRTEWSEKVLVKSFKFWLQDI